MGGSGVHGVVQVLKKGMFYLNVINYPFMKLSVISLLKYVIYGLIDINAAKKQNIHIHMHMIIMIYVKAYILKIH